ncbi:hypothetical protein D3C80_1821840 [compost metagenome]
MNHRGNAVIRPFRLINIIGILREPGGVQLPEVRVLGMVRGRFPDIVEAGPEKLPKGILGVPVTGDAGFCILRAPAGRAVAKR